MLKAVTGIVLTGLLVSLSTLAFNIQPVAAVDWWPMFHHDLSHTGYSTSTAPNASSTSWSYATIGPWFISPVVADGLVFAISGHMMYALNLTTGSLKWSYSLHWCTNGDCITYYWASAPTIAGGMVFASISIGKVFALNASTGVSIWNSSVGGGYWSSPAVADGKVYVGSDHDRTYCLDASTGAHIWNYTTGGGMWSSPAVADGRVFITCGGEGNNIYALNETTGELLWDQTTGRLGHIDPVRYSSPSVADGMVFWGSSDGKVYAMNETNGQIIWSYPTEAWVPSSPAVAYGKVFVGSCDGNVYALDEWTGNRLWNYTIGGYVYSSPAVADDKVFVGCMYALNQTTGQLIWSFTTDGDVGSSPAVAYGKVFVGSNDGKVYAFGSPLPHDIAVISVTASPTSVTQGQTVTITVVVKNEGTSSESFSVTAYYDNTAIDSQTVTNLSPGASQTLYFSWDTGGASLGTYTIKAVASTVPEETDTTDNTKIDGTVTVTAPTGGVGGVIIPIYKLGLLAPYLGLALTIVVATAVTAIYVKRVKSRKEKQ